MFASAALEWPQRRFVSPLISTIAHNSGPLFESYCSVRSAIWWTEFCNSTANRRNDGAVVSMAVQLCFECVSQSAVAYRSHLSLEQALCWGTNPFLVLALLASIDGYLHLSLPPVASLVSLSVSFYRLFILPFLYSNFCLQCSIVLFNFVSLCISLFYFSSFFYLSFPCCVSLFSVVLIFCLPSFI